MTADTTPSLVERLNDQRHVMQGDGLGALLATTSEAASRITEQDKALALAGETQIKLDLLVAKWEARAEAAEARCARLEAELRAYVKAMPKPEHTTTGAQRNATVSARALLAELDAKNA